MDDRVLRDQLVELLTGGHAHVSLEQALAGLAVALRGERPAKGVHSVYEELEHIRIAQEDILRYTLDSSWKSPKWPKGYWPKRPEPTKEEWKACTAGVRADLEAVCALVRDADLDLTAPDSPRRGTHVPAPGPAGGRPQRLPPRADRTDEEAARSVALVVGGC